MKLSKKAITALSFTLGACLFVSTALADMALGTGYDRLKNAAKQTAAQMEEGLDNYTIEMLFTMRDNTETMIQTSTVHKVNTSTMASEQTTATQFSNGETTSSYRYSDPKLTVWKHGEDEKYYVTEKSGKSNGEGNPFENPFDEEGAQEMEKLIDAFVGNLKDNVQMEDRADGGRSYSGSLSETQVPAIINAVSSFGIKQIIKDERRSERNSKLPEMESDVYVKRVTGTAEENEQGLLESLTGEVTLSGLDKNGVQHDLTMSAIFKLTEIGSTKVEQPDLRGKSIEKVAEYYNGFTSKYVGTYKNNIVMEQNGEFVKIGERVLEITGVDGDKVTGEYREIVKPEYTADYPEPYSFSFEYEIDQSQNMNLFTYTNSNGEMENGQIHPSSSGKLYIDLGIEVMGENSYRSNSKPYFDGELNRVFAE